MIQASKSPQIIVNCARIHSNLLQVICEFDGLYLFFLKQESPDHEPVMVGEGDIIDLDTNPEFRDIVTVTPFTTYWNPDLLWSIASLNEDHAITPAGIEAIGDDALWKSDEPDFRNLPQQADVA